MAGNQPQTVHALERGLSVLSAVNEFSPASLSILVDATGLPKATIVRLLHTLRAAGYVERAENKGYRLLPRVRDLFSSLDRESAPTQIIRRMLNDFATIVKWPAEFMVREGATMVIEVSNRDSAPINLRRFEHVRFPLLHSASGIALLAWSKPRQREDIIRSALLQEKSSERADVAKTTRRKISEALARGYGMQDYNTPIEGTRAISVPVFAGDMAVAAMALIFLRDALPQSQVDTVLVPKLKEIANSIGLQYTALLRGR
ncbi:MAG: IclR family transcriptional regulator [Pseudorhodoplanes sp.]|uniref:IclR family transcriptional regulator n=1 Tax=Pseudorhodoplanes sp. TaxID=1934341 RepID=UPI003D147591